MMSREHRIAQVRESLAYKAVIGAQTIFDRVSRKCDYTTPEYGVAYDAVQAAGKAHEAAMRVSLRTRIESL